MRAFIHRPVSQSVNQSFQLIRRCQNFRFLFDSHFSTTHAANTKIYNTIYFFSLVIAHVSMLCISAAIHWRINAIYVEHTHIFDVAIDRLSVERSHTESIFRHLKNHYMWIRNFGFEVARE